MLELKTSFSLSLPPELHFAHPVLNASGTFNAAFFNQLMPLDKVLGGVVTKTVTPQPQAGNPLPRTVELPGIGMLNSIGIQNSGVTAALRDEVPELVTYNLPVILSISAHSVSQFAEMTETILNHPHASQIAALEINLSCPNVEAGGVHFGSQTESVQAAVSAVTTLWKRPTFAKLTPNVSDIVSLGAAAINGGATGLTAINTVLGVAIDVKKRQPVLPRVAAGYSGPGIKPIALHAIWQLYRHFPNTPIIGVGGISHAQDVLEFMMAGASLLQVGTICFRSPMVFQEITHHLNDFCEKEGIRNLSDLIGCAHP